MYRNVPKSLTLLFGYGERGIMVNPFERAKERHFLRWPGTHQHFQVSFVKEVNGGVEGVVVYQIC